MKVVHCKKEPYDIYIGRPSKWGNPFTIGKDGTRNEVIEKYRQWILNQPKLLADLYELKGKILGCWCSPKACHGDVLIELSEKTKNKVIDSFFGKYRFLSNFYPSLIIINQVEYATVEHAYQAAKTQDPSQKLLVAAQTTPGKVKRFGRTITIRKDWNQIKIKIMNGLIHLKFTIYEDLRKKLLATANMELIEGNLWNDTFWGMCRGKGHNYLGKILMQVRENLKKDK